MVAVRPYAWEKLRNERQSREVTAAEELAMGTKKECTRLEEVAKKSHKFVEEINGRLAREETTVQEMRVKYADYEEFRRKTEKLTSELERTKVELAGVKEDKKRQDGTVEALTSEVKHLKEAAAAGALGL